MDKITFKDLEDIDSPLINQYKVFKQKYSNCILFFQVGSFFETYCEDAEYISKALSIFNLTLTKKNISNKDIPMAGVPIHVGEKYANELAKLGKDVAIICQSKNDDNSIERFLKIIVTPSTLVDEEYLVSDEHQYIMSIYSFKDELGVALIDFLSGEIITRATTEVKYAIFDLVSRYQPKEVLLYLTKEWEPELLQKIKNLDIVKIYSVLKPYTEMKDIIDRNKDIYFRGENVPYVVIAAHYFLLEYLEENKSNLVTLKSINYIEERDYLYLPSSVLSNLDILKNSQTKVKKGSLFELLDKCVTAKGSRLLKKWIEEPLINSKKINARYLTVGYFLQNAKTRINLQEILKDTSDLERILGRMELKKFKDSELPLLLKTLKKYYNFLKICSENVDLKYFKKTSKSEADDLYEILKDLNNMIDEESIIKKNYNESFDIIKKQKENGKQLIENYFEEEKKKNNIKNFKLEENKILGYFFEVTKSNYKSVPEYFEEKSSLTNSKRYVTKRLKELELEYNTALESYDIIYKKTISSIILNMLPYFSKIKRIIEFIAGTDILLGFAELSEKRYYKCPTTVDENIISIKGGKHPLLDAFSYKETIPNNCILNDNKILIITGPNMGGKSTYLKMVGSIIVMAQVGCFVPAQLIFHPVNRIFARMGANDAILNNQSTFMVEMEEMSYILSLANENSLLLIDELGRGTSTNDGIALAKSSLNYIHDKLHSKTICSTHYHELIQMEKEKSNISNFHAEVIETNHDIKFTFRIKPGGIDKSFGIEVAKKAGLPTEVIQMAQTYLNND